MAISVFDLFSIGIGPSSSHTVGPMRAARMFTERVAAEHLLDDVARVRAELFGSLGATGHGHGSVGAVVLGLLGEAPESVDVDAAPAMVAAVRAAGVLRLAGGRELPFDIDEDVVMHRRRTLPLHPNGMRFAALDPAGAELTSRIYYSVGGGFVAGEDGAEPVAPDTTPLPMPFSTGDRLLELTREHGLSISEVMRRNFLLSCGEAAGACVVLTRLRFMPTSPLAPRWPARAPARRGAATTSSLSSRP